MGGGCDGWSGVQCLNEIKDSVVAGFQWASKEVCVWGGGGVMGVWEYST